MAAEKAPILNTLKFAFPANTYASPSVAEMADFMSRLDVDIKTIAACYADSDSEALMIKFSSEEAMEDAHAQNPNLVNFKFNNGKVIQLRMSVTGAMVRIIKIYGLPPEVTDAGIVDALNPFGILKNMQREKFPLANFQHICTGVRVVFMVVTGGELPETLRFMGFDGKVVCDVRRKIKCFQCKQDGHWKEKCTQKSRSNTPETKAGPSAPVNIQTLKRVLVTSSSSSEQAKKRLSTH